MRQTIVLPNSTMYDSDILNYVRRLRIPNFRGVEMGDELPFKPQKIEIGILNEIEPWVLEDTPAVISVGQLVMEKGFGFYWHPLAVTTSAYGTN